MFFAYPACRTGPVVGYVFERGSWGNSVFGVALQWIVYISAEDANVLFHNTYLLLLPGISQLSCRRLLGSNEKLGWQNEVMLHLCDSSSDLRHGNRRIAPAAGRTALWLSCPQRRAGACGWRIRRMRCFWMHSLTLTTSSSYMCNQ